MKFCNQCGQGSADEAVFCIQCGTPLADAQQTQTVNQPGEATPTPTAGDPLPPPPPGMPPGAGAPPPPGYTPYRRAPQTDGMAVASLVLGIAGFFCCPLISGILAVIFGYMARRNIKESGGALGGDSMATAGIILGYVQLGLTLLFIAIWIITIVISGTSCSHQGCHFNMIFPAIFMALV
ncbi:MAG: hypothetical protein CVT63_01325 [Candidatus Anoxymicrobium japonicum]|uniref:DUF4190 domain-containing protein n=1 Tax=Candidatus Anoxymicrobium japonicum TaxID=2013648 RepID=A0A2N3G7W9_9ACTN|nr:MAG: hypothetical protein CVT63_01325 [Candidatus Anoxymicrobium japonicum]